jgi:hypothetical protein
MNIKTTANIMMNGYTDIPHELERIPVRLLMSVLPMIAMVMATPKAVPISALNSLPTIS